jgi:hypothetical protein
MKELESLKRVQRVESPPYLLNRIRGRIESQNTDTLPVTWQWAVSFAFGVLIGGNLIFTKIDQESAQSEAGSLVEAMGLQSQNQFYHE